jgi:single-strand DNA-binding protein
MSGYSRVIVMGNLTRDPELKYTPSGMAICEFTVAVNNSWTRKTGEKVEEVFFFDCQAWAKTGEIIAEHFKKGKPIFVDGQLRQERWEDASGSKKSRVRINVERFQFIGGKRDDESYGGPPAAAQATNDDTPADDVAF